MIEGMVAKGYAQEFAERCFEQIKGFGEYGFPESHAASFALLVYVSSWLKRYYPAAFAASLLNSQPMGFYAPAQLVQDARQHGVRVRPVDVNHSEYDCTLEPGNRGPELRLGFRLIAGLRRDAVAAIESARVDGPFTSLPEFGRRTGLPRAALESLSDADAFGSLKLDRRSALWHSLAQAKIPAGSSLFTGADDGCSAESLPELSPFDQVIADYRTTGLSLKGHPVGFYREHLDAWKVTPAERLKSIPHGTGIVVAGLVLLRQRPGTAKGITFVTLEDETGVANLILHPRTWERYYSIARHSPAWVARGVLESKDSVIHVVVRAIEDLAKRLGEVRLKPREFR
jgi:error-prone DNA polymerase